MEFIIIGKCRENLARVDKIDLGWFGIILEKLYRKNHMFTAIYCSSRIIYESGPGF